MSSPDPGLTLREFEVYMLLVSKALMDKDLAKHLNIETATARKHVSNILDKMGVHSVLELLVQYWYREQKGFQC